MSASTPLRPSRWDVTLVRAGAGGHDNGLRGDPGAFAALAPADPGLAVGRVEEHVRERGADRSRSANAAISASRSAQIRDTSDLEIPVSAPRALTRSSTLRTLVPVTYTSITTANRAWSIRRRRSNSDGKNDPACSFGIAPRSSVRRNWDSSIA